MKKTKSRLLYILNSFFCYILGKEEIFKHLSASTKGLLKIYPWDTFFIHLPKENIGRNSGKRGDDKKLHDANHLKRATRLIWAMCYSLHFKWFSWTAWMEEFNSIEFSKQESILIICFKRNIILIRGWSSTLLQGKRLKKCSFEYFIL